MLCMQNTLYNETAENCDHDTVIVSFNKTWGFIQFYAMNEEIFGLHKYKICTAFYLKHVFMIICSKKNQQAHTSQTSCPYTNYIG